MASNADDESRETLFHEVLTRLTFSCLLNHTVSISIVCFTLNTPEASSAADKMAEREITEDYYEILQVQSKATDDEIKASYRRLALLRHPDKNAGNPNATAEFQQASVLAS